MSPDERNNSILKFIRQDKAAFSWRCVRLRCKLISLIDLEAFCRAAMERRTIRLCRSVYTSMASKRLQLLSVENSVGYSVILCCLTKSKRKKCKIM